MPLNAAVAVGMVTAGIAAGLLGRWSAHRVADLASGSDIYTHRVALHKRWSEDKTFRLYYASMAAFPPFETRILPAWMDVHRKLVYNLQQYPLIQWQQKEVPRNIYHYENAATREAYELYDIAYNKSQEQAKL